MADKGKWFKLHIGWDDDPHIDALSLEDQARWCKFATYMKEHGTEGQITLISPARVLQNKFQMISFDDVLNTLKRFPNLTVGEKQNVTVTGVTNVTVTFKNWHRYQGDFSGDRVRKFRANVTAKKRGEEKEKKKRITSPSPGGEVKTLIDYFYQGLTEALKEKPTNFNGGLLGRTLKDALGNHTVEELKGRIDKWFKSTDPFIVANGFSPTLFCSKIPLLKEGPIHGKPTTHSNVRLGQTDPERLKAYD